MKNENTRIVGFDLGHAESALAVVHDVKKEEVNRIEPPSAGGRAVTVTAVAKHKGKTLIGTAAINQPGADERYLTFKGPKLDQESVNRPVRLFVEEMQAELLRSKRLAADRPVQWVFGAPSGWSPKVRAEYEAVLRSAGLKDVEVIPESRAALLFARDSGQVSADTKTTARNVRKLASGVILVADFGSSTCDFTAIVGLQEKPIDSGTVLGAGLIDREIMGWLLRTSPDRESLLSWLENDPNERVRLEYDCRRAKEDYFNSESSAAKIVRGSATFYPICDEDAYVDIRLTRKSMDAVLDSPLPWLNNRSWRTALHDDMAAAARTLGRKPDLVVLTGGASRMPFVLACARQIFGDRVIMGSDPEMAIAYGLALAGRIGIRTRSYRDEIKKLLTGGQIEAVVQGHLSQLAKTVGATVSKGFVDRYAIPAFRRWQKGEIKTLALMEQEVTAAVNADYSGSTNPRVTAAVVKWQDDLRPDLRELTTPICDRWRIPASALDLPPISIKDQKWSPAVGVASIVAEQAGNLAAGVAAAVVAIVIVALVSLSVISGPVGWTALIVGGVYAVGAALAGGESTTEKIRDADLPIMVRQKFKEATLVKKAAEKEQALATELTHRIKDDSGPTIVRQVSERIEVELERLARDAELMIS